MPVIIIPPNSFSESIARRHSVDTYKVISLINIIRKWNFQLLFYISKSDWYILKSESQFRELYYYFKSSSQIPFIVYLRDIRCNEELLFNNVSSHYNFKNLFLSIINYELQVPLIATNSQIQLFKLSCDACDYNSRYCKSGFELMFPSLSSLEFTNLLKMIQDLNLDNQIVYDYDFDKESIKRFVIYSLEVLGLKDVSNKMNEVEICDSFIRDINSHKADKLNILFALARMVGFPPAKDSIRSNRYSIDWHPNTDPITNTNKTKYMLYRCDVVDSLYDRGICHSGAKRIIFATSKGRRILARYTDEHDVPEHSIRASLIEYESRYGTV